MSALLALAGYRMFLRRYKTLLKRRLLKSAVIDIAVFVAAQAIQVLPADNPRAITFTRGDTLQCQAARGSAVRKTSVGQKRAKK
jgi:hypothetical protein